MNYEQISALLEKYWEGDTSLDEERVLKSYFSTGPVDERFRSVAPLFSALRQEQSIEFQRDNLVRFAPGPTTTWRRWAVAAAAAVLLAAGGWWWLSQPAGLSTPLPVAEGATSPAQTQPDPVVESPAAFALTDPQPVKAIAKRHKTAAKPTMTAPDAETERAMEEIKAALALVSSKLNKGRREASKNLHEIETLDKIIRKPSAG